MDAQAFVVSDAIAHRRQTVNAEQKTLQTLQDRLDATIGQAITAEDKHFANEDAEVDSTIGRIIKFTTALAAGIATLAVFFGMLVSTTFASLLSKLKRIAQRIAAGDFSRHIERPRAFSRPASKILKPPSLARTKLPSRWPRRAALPRRT